MKRIAYADLNDKAKENYNFHKVASVLADYGYNSVRLNDDVQGADFLAVHIDGHILKVQLKGRLTVGNEYIGKNIHIAFPDRGQWYLCPHDELMSYFTSNGRKGSFSCGYVPAKHQEFMSRFKI